MTLLSGALLGIIEEAGLSIMTMTEGIEADEFFASRITQQETLRQVRVMAETISNVPEDIARQMIEIDWTAWRVLKAQLVSGETAGRDALWFGVRSLVPATLMWLRVFRHRQPDIFAIKP